MTHQNPILNFTFLLITSETDDTARKAYMISSKQIGHKYLQHNQSLMKQNFIQTGWQEVRSLLKIHE